VTTFVDEINTPAGLVFDKQGNLFVACSLSGTVQRVSPDGKVTKVAKDLQILSDITTGPDGGIIVTNYQGSVLTRIDSKGKTEIFLNVPPGTIGITFDKEGNLLAVNWDASLLLKFTSRFSLPCPHCNKRIPVRLKPKQTKRKPPNKMI
jgi:sugar lactone lactonase YvrE